MIKSIASVLVSWSSNAAITVVAPALGSVKLVKLPTAVPNSLVLRVNDADHCDFESPTNWLCDLACTNTLATIPDSSIRSTVLELFTAGVLWLADGDSSAEDLWVGEGYLELLSAGAVSTP